MAYPLFGKIMPEYFKQILHTQLFSVLNIIVGFVSLFLMIKYLHVTEYGEYVLIQGFIAFSGLLFSQNIYSYARLHIPGASEETQYGYLKTVIALVMISYIVIWALVNLLHVEHYVWNFFEISLSLGSIVVFILALELINNELMRFFIAVKKIYLKNYAQFLQKIVVLVGTLVLVYCEKLNILNFLYLFILGQLVVFSIFLININLRSLLNSMIQMDVIKKGYGVAIPLLPIGLMSMALNYTDTLMIAKFVGKESVAQYGFASQIISIAMMMIGTSIVLTLFPYATEAHNKNDVVLRTKFFEKMFSFSFILALIFYMFSSLNARLFIDLMNLHQYNDVPLYLSILALFPIFQSIFNVSSHHLQILKIFKVQVYFAIVVIIENIVLNFYFIRLFGAMGATYASLISYITLAGLYGMVVIKHDSTFYNKLKMNYIKFLIFFMLIVSFGYLSYLFSSNISYLVIANVGLFLFLLMVFYKLKQSGVRSL